MPVIVVRFFNTVGPRQSDRYGMVIPNFVRQALAGEPLIVHGDGTQTRSFTWVGDVVSALLALAAEPRSVGQVFNIGNGAEVSIRELAEKISAMTGSDSPIRFVPASRGVRAQLRRHVAARAGHQQDPAAHRLHAEGRTCAEILERVIGYWSPQAAGASTEGGFRSGTTRHPSSFTDLAGRSGSAPGQIVQSGQKAQPQPDQRIVDRECRKTAEVPIVGPQLAHAVRQAQSGYAGIVDLRSCALSCRQTVAEHGPVRVVLGQRDERGDSSHALT